MDSELNWEQIQSINYCNPVKDMQVKPHLELILLMEELLSMYNSKRSKRNNTALLAGGNSCKMAITDSNGFEVSEQVNEELWIVIL